MKSLILQTLYDKVSFPKDATNHLYPIADKTNSPELEALLFCDKKKANNTKIRLLQGRNLVLVWRE